MKKFIIAICGIILAGGAMGGDPEHYQKPTRRSFSPDPWNVTTSAYSNSLGANLYNQLNKQIGRPSGASHGTHDDEGAVVLIIARDIYKNGGNFCMTQIQGANAEGRWYTWIDYYDYPNKYKCEPLCRPGYYGADCSETGVPDTCDTHKLDFGDYKRKTSGGWDSQITKNITVFKANNAESEANNTTATHRTLAVIKKMDHGVIVSPIEIIAERYKESGDRYSYIKSVQSNGQEFLLCAKGYKANSNGTDCTFADELITKCEFESRSFCTGFSESDFKSDQHAWDINAEENCNYFVCKAGSDYAFKPGTKICEKCETTRKQGIKDGVCVTCGDDRVFNNGICDKYEQVQKFNLLNGLCNVGKCWMESSPAEYSDCVFRKWDKRSNKCESKTSELK